MGNDKLFDLSNLTRRDFLKVAGFFVGGAAAAAATSAASAREKSAAVNTPVRMDVPKNPIAPTAALTHSEPTKVAIKGLTIEYDDSDQVDPQQAQLMREAVATHYSSLNNPSINTVRIKFLQGSARLALVFDGSQTTPFTRTDRGLIALNNYKETISDTEVRETVQAGIKDGSMGLVIMNGIPTYTSAFQNEASPSRLAMKINAAFDPVSGTSVEVSTTPGLLAERVIATPINSNGRRYPEQIVERAKIGNDFYYYDPRDAKPLVGDTTYSVLIIRDGELKTFMNVRNNDGKQIALSDQCATLRWDRDSWSALTPEDQKKAAVATVGNEKYGVAAITVNTDGTATYYTTDTSQNLMQLVMPETTTSSLNATLMRQIVFSERGIKAPSVNIDSAFWNGQTGDNSKLVYFTRGATDSNLFSIIQVNSKIEVINNTPFASHANLKSPAWNFELGTVTGMWNDGKTTASVRWDPKANAYFNIATKEQVWPAVTKEVIVNTPLGERNLSLLVTPERSKAVAQKIWGKDDPRGGNHGYILNNPDQILEYVKLNFGESITTSVPDTPLGAKGVNVVEIVNVNPSVFLNKSDNTHFMQVELTDGSVTTTVQIYLDSNTSKTYMNLPNPTRGVQSEFATISNSVSSDLLAKLKKGTLIGIRGGDSLALFASGKTYGSINGIFLLIN